MKKVIFKYMPILNLILRCTNFVFQIKRFCGKKLKPKGGASSFSIKVPRILHNKEKSGKCQS